MGVKFLRDDIRLRRGQRTDLISSRYARFQPPGAKAVVDLLFGNLSEWQIKDCNNTYDFLCKPRDRNLMCSNAGIFYAK